MKAANGTNEEQFSESGSDQEYEGRGIFPDASHLKEEDNEGKISYDEVHIVDQSDVKEKNSALNVCMQINYLLLE